VNIFLERLKKVYNLFETVDNSSWKNGPYSILPIHDEIEKEDIILDSAQREFEAA